MKSPMYSWLLISAAAGAMVLGTRVDAAPTLSPYREVMDDLLPNFYFPLDEAAGTASNTALTNLGSSAAPEARYVQVTGSAFNNGSFDIETFHSSYASVGATVGPTVIGKGYLTNPDPPANHGAEKSAAIAAQLTGFNPDFQDPYAYNNALGTTVNRVFEANGEGAIQLNQTIGGNTAFHGDATTHGFTIAMWVRNEDLGSGQFPRLFEAGGNNGANGNFLQLVAAKGGAANGLTFNTDVAQGRTVQVGYAAPGYKVIAESVHNDGQWTFIVASLNNDPALTPAQRADTIQIWERDRDATHLLTTGGPSLGTGASNRLGIAKIGYRDGDPGSIGQAQTVSDKLDEVAIWNRILQYDEREAMYVSATRPTGGDANTTSADGSWTAGANWSKGNYPQHHGNNNASYQDIVVNHNMTVQSADPANTQAWRTNAYNLTVNASGSLAMNPGTVIRTADDMTLDSDIAMNGNNGTVFGITFNPTAKTVLDAGGDVSIGGSTTITMLSPQNLIQSEGNLTINTGASLVLTGAGTSPAAGAQLHTIAQADYNAASGSALQEAGVLSGTFSSVSLPASPDGSGLRKFSILYENRASNGAGTVDTVKIGLAAPGDVDFSGSVTSGDILSLAANGKFNTASPVNWREGDFDNNGLFQSADMLAAASTGVFNTGPYAVGPGVSGNSQVDIVYDAATGNIKFDTEGQVLTGFILQSAANNLLFANANLANGFFVVENSGEVSSSFAELFSDNFNLGNVLPAGLQEAFLQTNLTFTYGLQTGGGVQIGALQYIPIPEPSSAILLGIAGMGAMRLRRRRTA